MQSQKSLKDNPYIAVRDRSGQWLVCLPQSSNCQAPRRCLLDENNCCAAIEASEDLPNVG